MFKTIVLHDYLRPLRDRLASRKNCGPYLWTPAEPGAGRGFYSASSNPLIMDRAGSSINLRLEWASDHYSPRNYNGRGYSCDTYSPGTDAMHPVIARLPHGRGYLAGWTMGEGMCGTLDSYRYEEAEDAARAAHDMASRAAEAEFEYREDENARILAELEAEGNADEGVDA